MHAVAVDDAFNNFEIVCLNIEYMYFVDARTPKM